MHGDHHMGFMDLLRMREKYMPSNRAPLLVMSPIEPFKELLQFYDDHFGNVLKECNLIDNDNLVSNSISDENKKNFR